MKIYYGLPWKVIENSSYRLLYNNEEDYGQYYIAAIWLLKNKWNWSVSIPGKYSTSDIAASKIEAMIASDNVLLNLKFEDFKIKLLDEKTVNLL